MNITSVMTGLITWLTGSFLVDNWLTIREWVQNLVELGNGFFKAALNMCTGMILVTPQEVMPEAWEKMCGIARGGAFMGIASDLVIVGFMISMIEYSITLRSRIEIEDLLKMFGRMCLANLLVHHFIEMIEGIWTITSTLVKIITPVTPDDLVMDYAATLPVFNLLWIIIGIVYAAVMVIISFKILTAFYERFLWAFLMIPFGGPAFATVVGYGHFNQTFKAYIKYIIATALEFVAFALLIVMLGSVGATFRETLMQWVIASTGEGNLLAGIALGYLSNICFASMTATMISKLDGQVSKMLAL